MKCHYEILGVPLDVEYDELKKSYRKLALKWHPDKNPTNQAQAKEQFQLIQQAYDILSDPQERSWYDRHRDAILRGGLGGDYKDTSLDVFPYFTTTCFKGHTDESQGFYAVYREVFNKIAVEDLEFSNDPEIQVPGFGTMESDYETVVHSFYAHWSAYSTKKTYSWLEPYDARDTPNRRVLRLVEKENKKIREKARRERNEEVRNLVAFVRKRDRRVQAWALELERRAAANALRSQQRREQAKRERRAQVTAEPSWAQFASVEHELRAIESKLAQDDPGTDDDEEDAFYCAACNKVFKTGKAFANHEQSKKHREGVAALRASLIAEEETEDDDDDDDEDFEDEELEDEELEDEDLEDEELEDEELEGEEADDAVDGEEVVEDEETEVGDDEVTEEGEKSDSAEQVVAEENQSESDDSAERLVMPKVNGRVEPSLPVDSDDDSLPETKRNQRTKVERKDSSEKEVAVPKKLKGKKAKDARKRARALAAETESTPPPESGRDKSSKSTSKGKSAKLKDVVDSEEEGDAIKANGVADEERTDNLVVDKENDIVVDRVNGTSDIDMTAEAIQDNTKRNVKPESKPNVKAKDSGKPRTNNVEETASSRGGRSKKDLAHKCVSCQRGFPSKNKLFEHLKATGHAVAVSESAAPVEKRSGRRNRAN